MRHIIHLLPDLTPNQKPLALSLFHTGDSVDGDLSPRDQAGLAFPDDYEKSAAVTSDILSLSSPKMNAHYSGRTGRDFAAVGPKRPEKEKEGKKNVGAPCNV